VICFEVVMIVILMVWLHQLNQIEHSFALLGEKQAQMRLMAEELRHNSEASTQLARSYVTTGELKYKQDYKKVQDIRDGRSPRPRNYSPIYWEVDPKQRKQFYPDQKTLALSEIFNSLPLTEQEKKWLASSRKMTERLSSIEQQAFFAMEGTFRDREGKYTLSQPADPGFAVGLLHSKAYQQTKWEALRQVEAFVLSNTRRMEQEVETLHEQGDDHFRLMLVFLALFLASNSLIFLGLRAKVIKPVQYLTGAIRQLGKGTHQAEVAEFDDEFGELIIAFYQMQSQLEHNMLQAADLARALEEKNEELSASLKQLLGETGRADAAQAAKHSSEVVYDATFNQAPVGIAHIALDGLFIEVNQRWCEIVGYNEAQIKTLNFREITHPEDLEQDLANVQKILDGTLQTYRVEKRYFHQSGKLVWIKLTVSLLRKAGGEPDFFLSIIDDISAQKQNEQALSERTQELIIERNRAEEANQVQIRFLSLMSHELRTPMNGVLGMAQLLLLTDLTEEQHNACNIILSSGNALVNILTDILDLSTAESGKQEVVKKPFSMGRMAENLVALFTGSTAAKGLTISYEIDERIEDQLIGDAVLLRKDLCTAKTSVFYFKHLI